MQVRAMNSSADQRSKEAPWRVRDRATGALYYHDTQEEAESHVTSVCTSDWGEWLRSWEQRLVIERNRYSS